MIAILNIKINLQLFNFSNCHQYSTDCNQIQNKAFGSFNLTWFRIWLQSMENWLHKVTNFELFWLKEAFITLLYGQVL